MKKILPPTYFTICLIIAAVLHFLIPIKQFINYPYNFLGFLFFVIGGILNIWTDQLFKKNKTTVKPLEKPSTFIQTGPFKISRNPMYLGMTILLIGAWIRSWINYFICWIHLIYHQQWRLHLFLRKKRSIQEQFGEEYLAYKKKVGRWI